MYKPLIIAKNSFKELLRKKGLQVLLVFGLVLIGSSQLFSFLTPGEEIKMIKDIGLSAIEFFGALIVIFGAIGAISSEIEKKTIYTLLAKPLRRRDFVIGKFLGISLTTLVNFLVMAIFFIGLLLFKEHTVSLGVFKALILIFFELFLIGAIALAVSTFASSSFTVIFSVFLYLVGHLIGYGHSIMEQTKHTLLKAVGTVFYRIIPNFENFNIRDKVAVDVFVKWSYLAKTISYGLIYVAVALLIGIYFFQKREI